MGVQLDVGGRGSPSGHAAGYQRPLTVLAEDGEGAPVGHHQLEVVAARAGAASTSGPRPATPRAPPRPRRRRPPSAPRRRRPRTATGRGSYSRRKPGLRRSGNGVSSRPALGDARGGVDAAGCSAARRRPGRRGPRGSPRRAGARRGSAPPTVHLQLVGGRRAEAERPQPQRVSRSRQRLQPRRQQPRAGPCRGGRTAQPLVDAPAAAAAEPRPEPHAEQRPPLPLRRRQQPVDEQLQRPVELAPRQPLPAARSRSARSSCGTARAQRLLFAAGEPQRLAARAARSGRRPGRARAAASVAQRPDPQPLAATRPAPPPRAAAARAGRPAPRSAAPPGSRRPPRRDDRLPPLGGGTSGDPGRRHPDQHLRPDRTPRRRQYPGALAPVEPTQPAEREEDLPGPLRLDRGADPLQRPRHRLGQLRRLDRIVNRIDLRTTKVGARAEAPRNGPGAQESSGGSR